jgi:hypothetical protein
MSLSPLYSPICCKQQSFSSLAIIAVRHVVVDDEDDWPNLSRGSFLFGSAKSLPAIFLTILELIDKIFRLITENFHLAGGPQQTLKHTHIHTIGNFSDRGNFPDFPFLSYFFILS